MKQQTKFQYRYYDVPPDSHVLALLGTNWIGHYGGQDMLHFHNCLEIGYCHAGRGTVTYGNKKLPYEKGMFSVIPAQHSHDTESSPGSICHWEYLFINVNEFLKKMMPKNAFARTQLLRQINNNALLLRHDENPHIANLVLSIMTEHRTRSDLFLWSVSGMLQALIVYIARLGCDDQPVAQLNESIGVIAPSLDYVDSHYSEKITVSALADACYLSETHFRRLFVQTMNISPLAYINRVRVEAACRLLHDTNESIGNIAVKCGFITITVLNRNFKEIIGVTPTQWRREANIRDRKLADNVILPYEGWRGV
jgi:AraC-like DNA-binding protein